MTTHQTERDHINMKCRSHVTSLALLCIVQSNLLTRVGAENALLQISLERQNISSSDSAITENDRISLRGGERSRKLWHSSKYNKECFTRCVVEQMSGEECRDYIYDVLETEFQLPHSKLMLPIRIDTLEKKEEEVVHENRFSPYMRDGITDTTGTEVQFRGSNVVLFTHDERNAKEVGVIHIPTNLDGYVSSCHQEGTYQVISYPRTWKAKEMIDNNEEFFDYTLPPVNCAGLLGTQCCEKVMATYTSRFIPLTDKDKKCLTCSFSQVPLRVRLLGVETSSDAEEGTMELVYEDHNVDCEVVERSVDRVFQTVMNMNSMVKHYLVQQINTVLQTGATCHQLQLLQHDLMTYTRAIPEANEIAHRLLCGMCAIGDDIIWFGVPMPTPLESDLRTILAWIEKPNAIQMVEELVISTDAKGVVTEIPKLPGSGAACKL